MNNDRSHVVPGSRDVKNAKHKKRPFNLVASLTGQMRLTWMRSPSWKNVRSLQKRGDLYQCSRCLSLVEKIQVDHVVPVGGFNGDWNDFVSRMFCDESNLQVLCKACHSEKGKEDVRASIERLSK